jgi:peptidoglycan hydrolase-like protein with peptidoglycan-binding domain
LPGADTSSTPNTGVILVTGGAQTLVPTNTPTPSPTPTATPSVLKQGASGAEVRSLQTKLKTLGYYSGTVDGDFGEATKKAVIAFQKASGLTADGVVGLKTLEKLETTKTTAKPTATPTPKATATPKVNENTYLKLGSSGAAVKTMQERLIELGYLNGVASGKFDTVTEQAVIAFQKRNVSYSDGIAGYQTLTALYKSSAKKASTSAGIVGISLKEGTKNSAAVKTLQRRLKALEYYNGSIDGDFGTATTVALKEFQRQNGLRQDGVAGGTTLTKLFGDSAKESSSSTATPKPSATSKPTNPPSYSTVTVPPTGSNYATLRLGDGGTPVKTLQTYLKRQGYYSGTVDGCYGVSTMDAVLAFQKAKGLKTDGVAGPATQRVLIEGDFPIGS